MHLLAADIGAVQDGSEPIDPGQSPADLILLTAADTEIALLAGAHRALGRQAPSLRLANLGWLQHPFSVDRYLEATASRSRLVVARILGGAPYWRYGLEQFEIGLRAAGVPFAALSGAGDTDPELTAASSLAAEHCAALQSFLVEGGPENAIGFLRHANHLLEGTPPPPPARPLLRAGYHWPATPRADRGAVRATWQAGAPVAALVFYRALLEGGGLAPVDGLIAALRREGLNPLPIFVASLKDPVSAATLAQAFDADPPDVVLNATAFAASKPDDGRSPRMPTPLDAPGRPVLQVVFSSGTRPDWLARTAGLAARDVAMHVALPEIDGRILTRAVSFKDEARRDAATECPIATYRAEPDRLAFTARLARAWTRLAETPVGARRIAVILANYPNRDGRLANGVGLDTPASAIEVLARLAEAGYGIEDAPATSADLMAQIRAGPTNWLSDRTTRTGGVRLPLAAYRAHWSRVPEATRQAVEDRWGRPEDDPFAGPDGFALGIHQMGTVALGLQPARGYNIAPEETYHSPDLVPPHNYFAFYVWLREVWGAQAIVHLGKHGNLEWLPGKALALSESCCPEAVLGPLPHLYPFIVNDPGEGAQAKRRTQAVIIDHLTPPMTRAETYGPLRDLEVLVDEYYAAAGLDPRRIRILRDQILDQMAATGLDRDAGIAEGDDADSRLQKLDAYLCELKEAQIRDGLHVFGQAPEGRLQRDLIVALARSPRGDGARANASLLRALAADLELGFDPLDTDLGAPWTGPRPDALPGDDPWRSTGDTVERLEALAARLVEGAPPPGAASAVVMAEVEARIRPAVGRSGRAETEGLLQGLDGRFVVPGPAGAPTRGRLDVLPTGRNFYSLDSRALPTRAAWTLGWRSATLLIDAHAQAHGNWPTSFALTAWGTSNMRTGGDDIAQALALMGCRPRWDEGSGRVIGFEILPLSVLGRPRVDVTLRISGLFRDAFPAQVDLLASAAEAVMRLDEPEAENPAAARFRAEGATPEAAARVFGAKPGAYGAGLQAMLDERLWETKSDLADVFLTWGGYAYGAGQDGKAARAELARRLTTVEAVVQNQDNREHDLLDSDDYYQFEGGLAATVESLRGEAPQVWHNDHSRPERPVIRTLEDEIGRVVRSRAANPKWIAGVMRHGYKGAFEIAATVDYLFAFAATTGAVRNHHFDLVHDAYLEDETVRTFIEEANPTALREIADRLNEAIARGLWAPRKNSTRDVLASLAVPAEPDRGGPVRPGED